MKITPTEAEQTRLQRAQDALGGYAVACATDEQGSRCYIVTKLADLTSYRVTADHRCTCPDSVQRESTRCKHFWMVVLTTQKQDPTPAVPEAVEPTPVERVAAMNAVERENLRAERLNAIRRRFCTAPPTPGGSAPAPHEEEEKR